MTWPGMVEVPVPVTKNGNYRDYKDHIIYRAYIGVMLGIYSDKLPDVIADSTGIQGLGLLVRSLK